MPFMYSYEWNADFANLSYNSCTGATACEIKLRWQILQPLCASGILYDYSCLIFTMLTTLITAFSLCATDEQVTNTLTHPAGKSISGCYIVWMLSVVIYYPIFTLTDVMKALKHHVNAQWKHFGTFLYVDPTLMDAICKHKLANPCDCMLELVSQWVTRREGTGELPRTWKTVVEAVRNSGFALLAKELAEKHDLTLSQPWLLQ